MDFETFLQMQEPAPTEDEWHEMAFESQIDFFEAEEADMKAADSWMCSFELNEEEINRRYEESLGGV